MTIHFSRVVSAQKVEHGASFSVQRLDLNGFGGALSPIAGLDHYRMSGPTFAPHPHAGFSAVSYLFEDSPGGLRNRDSQGHDFVVEPGAIVWTQAGSGVVHEERPVETGIEVHGIQLFVNLTAKYKLTPPQMFRLARHEVPEWRSPDGDRVRIVVGELNGIRSPLEPTEPFHLFDVSLQRRESAIPVRYCRIKVSHQQPCVVKKKFVGGANSPVGSHAASAPTIQSHG